jgi:hypothetical protein
MKSAQKLLIMLLLTLILVGAVPAQPVSAQSTGTDDGQVVIGGNYTLSAGETLRGDLVLIGGTASLEANSVVTGSVLIAGGTLEADGIIKGDVLTFGGILNLNATARVEGDLVSYGGINNIAEGARVLGSIVNNEENFVNFDWGDFDFDMQGLSLGDLDFPNPMPNSQAFASPRLDLVKQVGRFVWAIARAIGLAILAVAVSLFAAKPLERASKTLFKFPAMSLGIGLLTILVLPLMLLLLMITIILIPVSLIGLIGIGVAVLFGWFALSLMLGERLAQVFHTEWAPAVSTGIGSLALSLVAGITGIIPCIGWLFPFFFASAGLGAVLLSRFGSRVYVPDASTTSAKPAVIHQPGNAGKPDYTLPVHVPPVASPEVLPPLDLEDTGDDDSET